MERSPTAGVFQRGLGSERMTMKYTVSVTRIGYAHLDIEVEASSPDEAEDKALDQAGNHLFSEHSSEYETHGVTEVDNQKTIPV